VASDVIAQNGNSEWPSREDGVRDRPRMSSHIRTRRLHTPFRVPYRSAHEEKKSRISAEALNLGALWLNEKSL
jgi:hypothetical protein